MQGKGAAPTIGGPGQAPRPGGSRVQTISGTAPSQETPQVPTQRAHRPVPWCLLSSHCLLQRGAPVGTPGPGTGSETVSARGNHSLLIRATCETQGMAMATAGDKTSHSRGGRGGREPGPREPTIHQGAPDHLSLGPGQDPCQEGAQGWGTTGHEAGWDQPARLHDTGPRPHRPGAGVSAVKRKHTMCIWHSCPQTSRVTASRRVCRAGAPHARGPAVLTPPHPRGPGCSSEHKGARGCPPRPGPSLPSSLLLVHLVQLA